MIKKIFLFINMILFFIVISAHAETQNCNELDKLSKEYASCLTDTAKNKGKEIIESGKSKGKEIKKKIINNDNKEKLYTTKTKLKDKFLKFKMDCVRRVS